MKKIIFRVLILIVFLFSFSNSVNADINPNFGYKDGDGKILTCGQSDETTCNNFLKTEYPNQNLKCVINIVCANVEPDGAVLVDPNKKTATPDDTYTLLAPIGDLKTAPKNIGDYFNIIFKIAIGLCGALAVIMIVIGGVQYMGDESIFGKTEAKKSITSAILGLLIALGAYALLNTIDPNLLGKKGVNIAQVSAEIIDLPDSGDGEIDPGFAKKDYKYSTDASVSVGVTAAVSKLKDGWEISSFKVYPNERMGIILKKGNLYDNTNVIDVRSGINGFSEIGQGVSKDRKTPKGTWTILSVKTSPNGAPVYNKQGSNMGASFWLLSPTTNGERGIGMHGNKNGTLSRTYGCVRLKNSDILALLPYVHSGIPVIINN
jgi:lipoprotein-anchoring transpeptidase ErfK/SrfK